MLALEIQRGRDPMMKLDYSEEHGACAGCTLRLMELAQYSGQSNEDTSDKGKKECYYGDSWFSSVRTALQFAERGHAYVGAVKTATKFFPNLELEAEMEHFPSGSHIVMECDVPGKDVKLLAIGYRYNCKKTLLFVATKDAGDTLPGEPYIAKYNDSVGNVCQREVARPAILSNYFKKSNKVDSHNHVRQGIIALEKMWVTHDCWFRLVTTLIGITATDAWKASRHQSPGEDLSAIQFCDRLAYDCFENDFPNSDMCLFISGRNGSTNIDDMISPRQNPATPAVVTPTSIGAIFESHKFTKNHDDIEPYVDNRAPDSERCRRRVCRADGCKRPTSWVCGAHECFNFEYNANGKRCKGLYYCQEHWHVHWSQVGERFF